jgi:CYTH domain-containing protein/CHAD domain-containing protein
MATADSDGAPTRGWMLMSFVLDPARPLDDEVRRVGLDRLDHAIAALAGIDTADAADVAHRIHTTRKRCKELRALVRLAGPSLGSDGASLDHEVRDAARQLASIRDAQALLATFDRLLKLRGEERDSGFDRIRAEQVSTVDRATIELRAGTGIDLARSQLEGLRTRIDRWDVGTDFDSIGTGLQEIYARGRKLMARAADHPTARRTHRWRAAAKHLLYAIRLLEAAAPSVLGPLRGELEDLCEALGDEHDLAVLVARLRADPARYGGLDAVAGAVRLARTEQDALRTGAFRVGATIYAERPAAFRKRLARYWSDAVELGPESSVGGLANLLAEQDLEVPAGEPESFLERERKFVVTVAPPLPDAGVEFRQGYLAVDGPVSVRVREAGGERCTLTIKAGRGSVRTEFEWPIPSDQFDLAWQQTRGRRIRKSRYRIPWHGNVIEVDMFHDDLTGLVLAEVEFGSEASMGSFSPPSWFGREVTDDPNFTNAALAERGSDGPPT